jgi:hypothetical protein
MDDRIAKLKIRVRALHRGQAASQVRYPEDLRLEVTFRHGRVLAAYFYLLRYVYEVSHCGP